MRRADRLFQTVQLIDQMAVLDERFRDEPGRTLADLKRRLGADSTTPRMPPGTGRSTA